ncbi:hydroxymethylglutaryl-CoA lyase [Sciscionella sediminilitoris]|uniref:hydroxymethylglutaryl-CoA lyase n=1 Tax=Sciscionella sediminilitoris TaxID=1445613 RepID=UPI0004DF4B97|nr:hydroxymethylglutaryl-CoA lyase [Sciscionella sp. SE31]
MADRVTICECFARDGLQHEPRTVPTATKLELLDAFTAAGFRRIEATSYSHPGHVPAFADAAEVLAGLPKREGVAYKATCPNPHAVRRALADLDAGRGAEELSFLVSATEGHTERNLRTDRATQWQRVAEMTRLAEGRFTLVGVVSVAFGCPFEGAVDPGAVVEDIRAFAELGAGLITLGDTIGAANPRSIAELYRRIERAGITVPVVAHLHNTRGTALANCVAALDAGCRHFDSAIGGVGGHPAKIAYGQGLTGNACTEDLVALFESMGIETGLDPDLLAAASVRCEQALGRELYSMIAKTRKEGMHA